jgi:FkbM family methyltransferase
MRKLLIKAIYVARKYLFHTRLGKTQFAARVYALVFDLSAPDLTKPVVFRGVPLYVDPKDKSIVPSMVGGYFEEKELDIFEQLVGEASVFFDVGANIGVYSVIGCTRSPTLVAYPFEPIEENRLLLERNISSHNLGQRVRVQPFAASNKPGKATIHLHHSGTHSLENDQGGPTREIETLTLDQFTAQAGVGPDIMKIDVEGHEAAVIDGAWEMLARYGPTLFIEFIPEAHQDVGALISRLRSLFQVGFVVDEIDRTVVEIDLSQLERQRGCNLILTTNGKHAELIRRFVTN